LAAALRPALASRGVPEAIYVDNGSAFVDAWLLRACAKLGIKLTHSAPGRPQGRGKIERLFRTVRDQFLVEITGQDDQPGRHYVADLATLNRLFAAWVEQVYHQAVHSETGLPLAAHSQIAIAPLQRLKLTDIHDGRLHLDGRVIVLADPVRERLAAWLDHRNRRWPHTSNPHLLIHYRTAGRLEPVGRRWVWLKVGSGLSAAGIREDRILNEAHASGGDPRRLADLFGLSIQAGTRYTATVDHPDLVRPAEPAG
jgi:hypothetical protein